MERVLPVYKFTSDSHDIGELTKPYLTSWGDEIHEKYQWDGATMHWAAGLPKFGDSVDIATIEHDYPYVYEGKLPSGVVMTRKQVDVLFVKNLREAGISPFTCERAYLLVRAFGWIKWRSKTQLNKQKTNYS